ncbi:MAG: CoxG family protein, partial [Gemmatimonadota bacterium]
GCRELEKTSDTEFRSVVVAKVGPVTATFKGNVSLLDLDPPRAYTIAGQGQGGAAGFAKMKARVTLSEDPEATLLRYEAQAEIGGKLASIGSRLVQSVAKKNADDFFVAFAERLGAPAPAAPAAAAAVEAPAAAAAAPAIAATPVAAREPTSAGLPSWVIAIIAACAGVVLGFILGRFG